MYASISDISNAVVNILLTNKINLCSHWTTIVFGDSCVMIIPAIVIDNERDWPPTVLGADADEGTSVISDL